jgi:hypothetical protein
MFQYLENLRRKPEAQRRKSIFLISLSVTLVILAVWLGITIMRVRTMDFSLKDDPSRADVPSLSDTFSEFGSRMKNIFNSGDTYVAPTNQ